MPKPVRYVAMDGTVTWRVRFRIGTRSTSETFPNEAAAKLFVAEFAEYGAQRAVANRNRRDAASDDYVPTLREWYATAMANKTGITGGTAGQSYVIANHITTSQGRQDQRTFTVYVEAR